MAARGFFATFARKPPSAADAPSTGRPRKPAKKTDSADSAAARSTASTYSHASVVDLSRCSSLLSPPNALGALLSGAAGEALDMKPARAERALAAWSLLGPAVYPVEDAVISWLLHEGARLAAAAAAIEEASAARLQLRRPSTPAPPPPAPDKPSDASIASIARELRYAGPGGRVRQSVAAGRAQRRVRRMWRAARALELHMPFALTLLAVVCALARAECDVALRPRLGGRRLRARDSTPEIALAVTGPRAKFVVVVAGAMPAKVVFFAPKAFAGKEAKEEFAATAKDCTEVISEFAVTAAGA